MKIIITALLVFFSVEVFAQTIAARDLQLLPGSWKGTLTYIDYGTGKPFTMPANIDVTQIAQSNQFVVAFSYPKEPKANGNDTFLISNNGKMFNGAPVKKVTLLKDGGIMIVTEKDGEDGNDNKKAILKHTYTIEKNNFTNVKEVKFIGEEKWMIRNEYKFSK